MTTAQIELPPKLVPVFDGQAIFRGAHGGRGSAKTRSFAKMAAVYGYKFAENNLPGLIVCGREFMNSLGESSFAEVKAAIASEPWLADAYDVGEKYIRTKCGRIEFAFIGLRHNLASIKSKSRIRVLWVDEGEDVSESAWSIAIPTVREDDSEIWITWNPARRKSATHQRFRENPPAGAKIVELNWKDNPWFPATLNLIRMDDLEKRPDQYDHIWNGGFVSVSTGAYYAKCLTEAKEEGRIGNVAFDPLIRVRVFCDLGGTGARADAFAMWPAQFIKREIRVRDYYEAQGQQLADHIQWLNHMGYTPKRADIVLPHDGDTNDRVYNVSFKSAFQAAGYHVTVVPNQGKGAARMRVEEARRIFPCVWFDEKSTEAGREALGWYHERKSDDHRKIGLGPEHDWSSHGSDAFGLLAIAYEEPRIKRKVPQEQPGADAWMG